jgi:transcriptional regulator with XRE-family HTH domain
MKRGRPKGVSRDLRSYGPLGDLIRKKRLDKNLGLADVAKACKCSLQFISNIEHGRAPLPWDKAEKLSKFLDLQMEDIQAANLSIRSDFKTFLNSGNGTSKKEKNIAVKDVASLVALATQDGKLMDLLQKYHLAPIAAKKRFFEKTRELF